MRFNKKAKCKIFFFHWLILIETIFAVITPTLTLTLTFIVYELFVRAASGESSVYIHVYIRKVVKPVGRIRGRSGGQRAPDIKQ